MFVVGLQCAGLAFMAAGLKLQIAVVVTGLLLLTNYFWRPEEDQEDSPVTLPGTSLWSMMAFFNGRFDFLNNGFRSTGQALFQFHLLKNTVIVVSGNAGRKKFFGTKEFDLYEGFRVLSGSIPLIVGVTDSNVRARRTGTIHKRLAALQKNSSLTKLMCPILDDCRTIIESYGQEGVIDPFEKIYELMFQITVRTISCSELSDDADVVARLKILYDKIDTGTTAATILFPWFPGPGMMSKLYATKQIYDIVNRAIDARQKSGITRDDTLQMLLDAEDDRMTIIGFIIGLFMAGARATGTSASWLITFLGCHPEWHQEARLEVQTLLSPYSSSHDDSISSRLATVPISAWESHTPILDGFIRETLRLAQPHIAMRRNMGPDIYIGDRVVPTGAFLLYPFSDVHLNPTIYEDPYVFDPSREERKDKDREGEGNYEYVGWGAGKNICAGQRLARIELKLVASMFLLGFDFSIVDHSGKARNSKTTNSMPRPNWNDTLQCRLPSGSCYLKYERREGIVL